MSVEPRRGAGVARRVRGAWRMVLANYCFRATAAILGASAIADVVAPAVAGRPGGERDLFTNGSALFLEVGLRALPRLRAASRIEVGVVVAVVILGVFPFAALLHALVEPRATMVGRLRASLRLGGRLALLLGLAAVVEAVCGVVALVAWTSVDRPSSSPGSAALAAGLALTGVLPWMLAMTMHDLARVAVVARDATVFAAVGRAARVLRRRPGAIALASLLASSASALAAVVGFAAAVWLGLASTGAVVVVLVVQQLAVLAIVTARASYYARLTTIDEEV